MRKIAMLLTVLIPALGYSQPSFDSTIRNIGKKFLIEKDAVGLSVGIYRNGNMHFYNFGSTNTDRPTVPTKHTIYEIGSITKTFVSFVLANAVMENKLNLSDDIRNYLPGTYPNLSYQGHPIRIVHLANTTSLLPDNLPILPDTTTATKNTFYKKLRTEDLLKALLTFHPDTIPGTRTAHSNTAAQLLAYILERVYKLPMDKLIQKYISHPFQMDHTGFTIQNGLARGYTSQSKQSAYESSTPYFKYTGGLRSSASDMVKYIRLMLDSTNKVTRLVNKRTADIDASTNKVLPLRSEVIAAPDIYSTALNWYKYQPAASSLQVWADGGTSGFNSYLVLYPFSNTGIIILSNKSSENIFRALPGMAWEISQAVGK